MGAAGCSTGGNNSGDSADGSSEKTSSEKTESSEETVGSKEESVEEPKEELTGDTSEIYWFSTVSGFGPANWNVDSSPALDHIRDEFGLTFNLEQPPTDAETKLGLMIATGDLPDLMSCAKADVTQQLIDSGKVWPIEEFMQEYDPDSWLLTEYPEDAKKALTDKNGGWYTIPSHLETADNRKIYPPDDQIWIDVVEKGTNGCIMFNKDMMDELGITEDMVRTEKGFYEACELVKNSGHQVDGQSVVPVMFHCNLWIDASLDGPVANNFGVVPIDDSGNYLHKELTPGYKEALKFMNNCIQKGYADVNTLTIDETAMGSYLQADRVFCWIGNQAQDDKAGKSWVSFGPIAADSGARPATGINQSAGTGWIQTMVSKDCAEPEKLAKMLSWSTSREGLLVHYYGTEGVNYEIDDKGIVTRTDEGQKINDEDYKSNVLLWPFANTSFERNTEPVPDPSTNRGVEVQLMPALGKDERTYIYNSALIDFPETLIEPSSDLGIAYSQVKNYLESQKAKIVTAADDAAFEAEYQSMVDTLKNYKIDEIDAEYDKAYKEFCGNIGMTLEDVNADIYK